MLGNNEKIPGVKLGDVFLKMLGELPWKKLMDYIQANPALLKQCQAGGHRIDPNKRDRLHRLIFAEAGRAEFAESVTNGVFAAWYPERKELNEALESYFHSEDYTAYRQEHEVAEDEYVLSDAKFDDFFKVQDLPAWLILLCFSPLRFTAAQAERILHDKQGSAELVDRVAALEGQAEDLQKKNAQLQSEAERLRARQIADAAELQDLKKQVRGGKSEADQLQQRLDSAQAEIRRLSQKQQQADGEASERDRQVREECDRQLSRLQSEFNRVSKDLSAWQSKYEEQRLQNRTLQERNVEAEKIRKQSEKDVEVALAKVGRCEAFADLLLSRIDWPKLGAAMKMTPTVRKGFNSLVKKLDYEEDLTLSIEGTLPEFWQKLCADEMALVERISSSQSLEFMGGDFSGFWDRVADDFNTVQLNLEARAFMLGMLQKIFAQLLTPEDLEQSVMPVTKDKK